MIQDFLGVVEWGELDYLVIDLPPGTGDVQLSLCQTVPITGAVIVSTPQDVAWNVAQKAIVMFDKLNAPILGIIENMSHFVCRHCGEKEEIFGAGGARRAAGVLGIPFLGEIPLVTDIRSTADAGDPVVHSAPGGAPAAGFTKIAENLAAQVSIRNIRGDSKPVPAKIGPPNEAEFWIEWSDGKRSTYAPRALRGACPCAACVDEVTGRRRVGPESVREDVRVAAVSAVGRYALQVLWSDGHDTGLYGFGYLRETAGRP
jgi:ATP-binding protein involved in chromosome partitioning